MERFKYIDLAATKHGCICNNNCIFCEAGQYKTKDGYAIPLDIDTEEVRLELKKGSAEKFEDVMFTASAGEPTTRSDIIELLSYAKQLGYKKILLQTNGRMFYYPEFTKKVVDAGCNFTQIGLHAPTAELHDRITMTPGSFEQTVQGIKNLLEYKSEVRTDIYVVIHKLNYKHITALTKFVSQEFKGIRRVVLFPPTLTPNEYAKPENFIARITDIKPYLEKALGILEENGFSFSLDFIPFCVIDKKFWENITPRQLQSGVVTYKPPPKAPESCFCAIFKSCNGCIMKEKCPGTWQSYASLVGTSEFKPIKSR